MVFRYSKKKRRSKTMEERQGVESIVRDIKRKTRKRYNSEEKIRIVLEGLRGEDVQLLFNPNPPIYLSY